MRFLYLAFAALVAAFCAMMAVRAEAGYPTSDVLLVLAVDASGSVDGTELKLQREGYAAALTHPDVIQAITEGAHGRILVAYFEWSGCTDHGQEITWSVIDSEDSARLVAAQIIQPGRRVTSGTTCIAGALTRAGELIAAAPEQAERTVIDISGDGPEIAGAPAVQDIRDKLIGRGITINGMPILVDPDAGVADFYERFVVGGPAHFIEPAKDFGDIEPALRRKLVQEIG